MNEWSTQYGNKCCFQLPGQVQKLSACTLTLLNKRGEGWPSSRDRFTAQPWLCDWPLGTLPLLCTWHWVSSMPQVALPVLRNTIILYVWFFLNSQYLEIMWELCHSPSKRCFHPIKVSTYVASPGMYFKVWVKVEDVSVVGERTVENSRNQN